MLNDASRDITVEIPNGWRPRPYQQPLWNYLKNGGKRAAAVWHRRAGKDSLCLNWGCRSALLQVGNYWHMLPEQKQGRKVIWDAVNPHTGIRLIDQAFPEAIRDGKRDDEMIIRVKNGSTWQVVGSDNYNSLMGAPPRGVVFSEWSLAKPMAWDFIRPILAENGGWALFIYTPRGRNHGWDVYEMARKNPDWFAEILSVNETNAIPMSVIEEERRSGMPEEFIQQEYYCSFNSPLAGAFWGQQLDQIEKAGQITKVDATPEFSVKTAWDIGFTDDVAIWFYQPTFLGIKIVDYYENRGKDVPHYAEVIRNKPYNYETHWLPPDAKAQTFAAGGRTVIEQLVNLLGMDKCRLLTKQDPEDWIQAARVIIPRCWFDATRTEQGMKSLRAFQREWDEDRRCFKEKYLHNWASHAASAFGVLASVYVEENPSADPGPVFRNPSLDEIYERRESTGRSLRGRI